MRRCQVERSLWRQEVHYDQRMQLASEIYHICKDAWRYSLPTDVLENEYLKLCRAYVLTRLQQGRAHEKRQATRILQSIAYEDSEMVATLRALEHDTDEEVRRNAAKALESVGSNSSKA
jgi:hypothetical protein